ncbi:MAG: lasso peptide biosynthesis B2 protein [Deltaproteobacteria bacterium]|nr:lasso peptide biosynthesis B2 protein [Deltaproteobacteria bacterium]
MWPANWQKFMGLPRWEQWWLVQAFLVLPLMGLGLRLLGLRRLQALLSHWPLKKPGGALEEKIFPVAQSQARCVEAAARHGLYRATCLPRSLALWWLLRCHGMEANLQIGVKLVDTGLAAHAWVELQGQPLNEVPDVHQHFSAFGQAIVP